MATNKKTTVDKLASDIQAILDDYGTDISANVAEATTKVGKAGVKALKSASKVFGGTGKYAKSWTSTTEAGRIGTTVTLHNKLSGLPHLLEHGHAKRGGGRVAGKTHIAPVETMIVKSYELAVKEACK